MTTRRPPRLDPGRYIGRRRYLLTICTFRSVHYFGRLDVVDAVQEEFLRTCHDYGFEDIAHCFMPDHLHALVEGVRDDADLANFVKMFKQRSSHRHRRDTGTLLWQDGFHDHALRNEESTGDIVAHLLNNPARAGLCKSPVEYPNIGSSCHSVADLAAIVQDRQDRGTRS